MDIFVSNLAENFYCISFSLHGIICRLLKNVILAGNYQLQNVFSKVVACQKTLKSSSFAERLTGRAQKNQRWQTTVALSQVPFELHGSEDERPFPKWRWFASGTWLR